MTDRNNKPVEKVGVISRIENRQVFFGLLLIAISTGVDLWQAIWPSSTPTAPPSSPAINQTTSGEGNRPVAIQQSGPGGRVQVGDVHVTRDPTSTPAEQKAGVSDGQAPPTQKAKPAPGGSLLDWLKDNAMLILTALGVLIGFVGLFRPGKSKGDASNSQTIKQWTAGQGNQPVAINQSGTGSTAHVGDMHQHRDPGAPKG